MNKESRFRSSHIFAAPSDANFGLGALAAKSERRSWLASPPGTPDGFASHIAAA